MAKKKNTTKKKTPLAKVKVFSGQGELFSSRIWQEQWDLQKKGKKKTKYHVSASDFEALKQFHIGRTTYRAGEHDDTFTIFGYIDIVRD